MEARETRHRAIAVEHRTTRVKTRRYRLRVQDSPTVRQEMRETLLGLFSAWVTALAGCRAQPSGGSRVLSS
jgi:hypothetical protein